MNKFKVTRYILNILLCVGGIAFTLGYLLIDGVALNAKSTSGLYYSYNIPLGPYALWLGLIVVGILLMQLLKNIELLLPYIAQWRVRHKEKVLARMRATLGLDSEDTAQKYDGSDIQ